MTPMGASLSSATPDRICGSAGPRLANEQAATYSLHTLRSVAGGLFAHHVQLLGTSRARWATQPIR